MRLTLLIIVFLICLYINYRFSTEGFDNMDKVSSILGYVLGAIFFACIIIYVASSTKPRFTYTTNASITQY